MHKKKENYGDVLGKYIVEKISQKKVVWVFPKHFSLLNYFQPIYVTIGSVLMHITENCIIWGSGIISKEYPIKKATFLAVRGPKTRQYLIDQGYDVPEVYGDPALLLPEFYNPVLEKKFRFGIIPHYNDYKEVSKLYKSQKDYVVIDLMTNNAEDVTDLLLQCERIVSSSLHGLIVSHAYRIPAVWVQFSNKLFGDGIKFQDYFESVELVPYIPTITEELLILEQFESLFVTYQSLPKKETVEKLKVGLMKVCPFV
ncbi:polysaccharide pyruvyl transferase family protein [Lutibacter sp. B1]|nr:polysaccharide pyruvyl transferase family protein [Lutibacter sp. B1]